MVGGCPACLMVADIKIRCIACQLDDAKSELIDLRASNKVLREGAWDSYYKIIRLVSEKATEKARADRYAAALREMLPDEQDMCPLCLQRISAPESYQCLIEGHAPDCAKEAAERETP